MTEKDTTIVTYKRIRYSIPVPCPHCLVSGFQRTKHGLIACRCCTNGEVQRWVNEVVAQEVETDADAN